MSKNQFTGTAMQPQILSILSEQKDTILANKKKLRPIEKFRNIYIEESRPLESRIGDANLLTVLSEMGKRDKYIISSNGRLINKTNLKNTRQGCIKVGVWNVRGWSTAINDSSNFRTNITNYSNLDILAICETFLKQNQCINIDGYTFVGQNREHLHPNAKRGSGGIGFLIKTHF